MENDNLRVVQVNPFRMQHQVKIAYSRNSVKVDLPPFKRADRLIERNLGCRDLIPAFWLSLATTSWRRRRQTRRLATPWWWCCRRGWRRPSLLLYDLLLPLAASLRRGRSWNRKSAESVVVNVWMARGWRCVRCFKSIYGHGEGRSSCSIKAGGIESHHDGFLWFVQ